MKARRLSSTHRAVSGAFVLGAFLFGVLPARPEAGGDRAAYLRVETVGEMLRAWGPETHLYVMGNPPLEDDVLAELAGWLDGKHWTVLLVEDASGQSYTGVDGVVHTGADAIEWGVGEGMLRRPSFAKLVHPRTGEPDGAVFAIVLAQQALYYTSSETQKSRGLGDFSGGLDQWAIQALRQGRNVVAAVKDTVGNVDLKVEAGIEQEEITARRRLAEAMAGLADYEARERGLAASHPQAAANLNLPDAATLGAGVAAAGSLLDKGRFRQAEVELGSALGRQRAASQAIASFLEVGQGLDLVGQRLADLEKRAGAAQTQGELAEVRRTLAQARDLYSRAAPGYVESYRSINDALSAAELAISRSERAMAQAEARAAMRRAALRALPYVIGFLLLAFGFALNRRRRPFKVEALNLLAAWRTALDRKLAALYDELEARVDRFVGPARGAGCRHWDGESLKLAEQIRADVGSLTILWSSANSVLQQAEALVLADGAGAVANFFFPHRYRQGIALLRDQPVPFDPADGLPQLFGEARTWRDELLGDLASYEPFQKSLQEIVGELNLRAGRAADALDRFERAVVEGPPALEETAERSERTAALKSELSSVGADDGLFLVPEIFAVAAPAAAATLERARERFRHDPVAAFGAEVAAAGRIAGEALDLAELAHAARREALPAIEAGAGTLRQAGIATGWIEEERSALSERAQELAGKAAGESVRTGIEELGRSLTDLRLRVERAAGLTETLGTTTRPEIGRVASLVEVGRFELSDVLELPADRFLREADADPSVRVASATEQADRAHEALGQGALEVAEAALAEAARLSAEADAIVEASCQAFADHRPLLAARRTETQRLEEQVPLHERTLGEIQESFAPSVLILRSGNGTHPNGNWTLADNVKETLGQLVLAREKTDRADQAFHAGELLGAARLLREVAGHQEQAGHRLAEIAERKSRLDRTTVGNRSRLAALDLRVREGQLSIAGDPRTMRQTLDAFAQSAAQVEEARRKVQAAPGDPLLAEEDLVAADTALEEVESRMAPADRQVFDEAQASVEAAARQLEAAAQVAKRAAKDRVPDSAAILQARDGLEKLLADHSRLGEALRVEHGDWHTVDAEADRVAAEAAQIAATLTGELEAAKQACSAIDSAGDRVRQLKAYGSWLAGDASAVSLARARQWLESGHYQEAENEALQAHREATRAIAAAEARREAERAAEAERRRQQEAWESRDDDDFERSRSSSSFGSGLARSSGSSGGSSWGGGSSSSSSGSSRSSFGSGSSGSSKSSFGSSGSGSSKSGW